MRVRYALTVQSPRVDYDEIAANYDRRYESRRYDDSERMLRDWIAAAPPGRFLEVGCGTGHWLAALREPARGAFGLDPSAGMLARARGAIAYARLVRGEATQLPFAEDSVQALLCMNTLHHFPDRPAFIAEAARVLTPGGAFCTIGLDPHRGQPRWPVYEYFEGTLDEDLQRYPPCDRIAAWLEAAAFTACATRRAQAIRSSTPAERALTSPMMRKDGTSQLALLSNEAYASGIERIRAAAERERQQGRKLVLETDLELMATTAVAGGSG